MNTPVLSIVGRSNSGKTTLLEKIIIALTAQGMRIATIKHSHHQPEMDQPGKDSWRHKQAGASASLLVGPAILSRLMLSGIHVSFTELEQESGLKVEVSVKCNGKTGVEMEALTAVSTALLTIYDMCKAVDKGMTVGDIRLEKKQGGKFGDWVREQESE